MSADSSLTNIANGIVYFRIVCFEVGPDLYYLLRYRIVNIYVSDDALTFDVTTIPQNRLVAGKWVECETLLSGPKSYKMKTTFKGGKEIKCPFLVPVSASILFVYLDDMGDAVVYRNESDQPDEDNPFRDFPRTTYERLAELLVPLR